MTPFKAKTSDHIEEINNYLESWLPDSQIPPKNLHQAMNYSVMNGGKRIRPLLTFAAAESLNIDHKMLIPAAASIELLHSFSLVHDDLPCMDDDDLRRGQPATHKAFDEATAVLAADALLSLAFEILSSDLNFNGTKEINASLISLIANATGSNGITGGQALDLNAEGLVLGQSELEHIYRQKTGKLLRACVLSPCCFIDLGLEKTTALERYIDAIGLAFQIKDDIIEAEGATEEIGKSSHSDIDQLKATFPKMFGLNHSKNRVDDLLFNAKDALLVFDKDAEPLIFIAEMIVSRSS
jgi:farnesyl diphosphate synthase